MIKKDPELKFVDDILIFLKNTNSYSSTKNELSNELIGKPWQEDWENINEPKRMKVNFNIVNDRFLIGALNFLKNRNYIVEEYDEIALTFEGIIFIAQNGFVGELRRERVNLLLQRIFWLVAVLSFLLAFISLFLTLSQ